MMKLRQQWPTRYGTFLAVNTSVNQIGLSSSSSSSSRFFIKNSDRRKVNENLA